MDEPKSAETWHKYAVLLGFDDNIEGVRRMLSALFKDKYISEWDGIWSNKAATIVKTMLDTINIENAGIDTTPLTTYMGGQRDIQVSFSGRFPRPRNQIETMWVGTRDERVKALKTTAVVFTLRKLRMAYSTQHFSGVLYNGAVNNDLLDGAIIFTPENAAEKRNPRVDDRFLAKRLITHLNQNLEYWMIKGGSCSSMDSMSRCVHSQS